MKPQTKKHLIGLLAGIAISLVVFFLISPSLFALAIGCVAGVYFAQPESLTQGAIDGAAVAAPLGIYLSILTLTAAPSAPRAGLLAALEDLLLILVSGGVYGFVFVWLTRRISRGQRTIS